MVSSFVLVAEIKALNEIHVDEFLVLDLKEAGGLLISDLSNLEVNVVTCKFLCKLYQGKLISRCF